MFRWIIPLFLALAAWTAPPTVVMAAGAYVADMEVTVRDAVSVARIWAREGELRMATRGGRASSGMLAHYREGKAWALMPGAGKYQEFPLGSLRDSVPHFFDPALKTVEKKLIGQEVVAGVPAIKYQVVLKHPGRRFYRGHLWEAEALPGYPLQWQDAGQPVIAIWRNAGLTDVPDDLFQLPAEYSEQNALPAKTAQPTCKKRPPARD